MYMNTWRHATGITTLCHMIQYDIHTCPLNNKHCSANGYSHMDDVTGGSKYIVL